MKEVLIEGQSLNPIEMTVIIRGVNCVFVLENGMGNEPLSDRLVEKSDLWEEIPDDILALLSKQPNIEEWRLLVSGSGQITGLIKVIPPEKKEAGEEGGQGFFNLLSWPRGSRGHSFTFFSFSQGEQPKVIINSKGRVTAYKMDNSSKG